MTLIAAAALRLSALTAVAVSASPGLLAQLGGILTPGNVSAVVANVGMAGRNVLTKVRLQIQKASAYVLPLRGDRAAPAPLQPGSATGGGRLEGDIGMGAGYGPDSNPGRDGASATTGEQCSTDKEDKEVGDDDVVPTGRPVATAGDAVVGPGPHVVFGAMSFWSLAYCAGLALVTPGVGRQVLHFPASLRSDPAALLLCAAAVSHALYTVCSFSVLSFLDPASHAISNAMKHVVVIGSSTVVLGQHLSAMQGVGAVLAVGGVLAYNVASAAERAQAAALAKVGGVGGPQAKVGGGGGGGNRGGGGGWGGLRPGIEWFFRSWMAVATSFLVVLACLVVMRNRSTAFELSLQLDAHR